MSLPQAPEAVSSRTKVRTRPSIGRRCLQTTALQRHCSTLASCSDVLSVITQPEDPLLCVCVHMCVCPDYRKCQPRALSCPTDPQSPPKQLIKLQEGPGLPGVWASPGVQQGARALLCPEPAPSIQDTGCLQPAQSVLCATQGPTASPASLLGALMAAHPP